MGLCVSKAQVWPAQIPAEGGMVSGRVENRRSLLHSASKALTHALNKDNDIFVTTSSWVDFAEDDPSSQRDFLPSDGPELTNMGTGPYDSATMANFQEHVQSIVTKGEVLGRGSFGTVYKGQLHGVAVAIKVLCFQGAEDVRNEFLTSLLLSHKHLVRTYMAFQRKVTPCRLSASLLEDAPMGFGGDGIASMDPINLAEERAGLVADEALEYWESIRKSDCAPETNGAFYECCIVQELCNCGDMYRVIKSGCLVGQKHLKRTLALASDVARGLAYMHKFNVVHLDLKPQNVLLSKAPGQRPICKIGDFGLSRAMPADMDTVCVDQHGTAIYCPAEMLSEGLVSPTADIYALALIVGEMISGKLFYEGLSMAQAMVAVFSAGLRPELPEWVPPALKGLLEDAWSADRTRRPTSKAFYAELRKVYRELK
jgi:serine/threonine protein kinase